MCCLSDQNQVTIDIDGMRSALKDKSIRVIDVRRESEYKQDHISSAVNLPLADLLSADTAEHVIKLANSVGIDNDTRVAIYDDTFGALASRVAWALEYIGHTSVLLLNTTYGNWKSMGLENDSVIPDIAHKTHSLKLRSEIMATSDYLQNAQGREDLVLIDNRERLNFLEQHIPGAINIPYRTLGNAENILRPKEEIKRLLENRNISQNSEIITYCGSVGTLSGLAYYALKTVGMNNTKLYVRSFKEWLTLQNPIEKQPDAHYWDLSAE